jgi:hypothetical protein
MIRVFGVVVALVALMAPAQAALITYGLNGSAAGVVTPTSAGTAANFAGSGSVLANDWQTGGLTADRTNSFSFTAGGTGFGFNFTNLAISARRNSTTGTNGAEIQVYYNVGPTSNGQSGTSLGTFTLTQNFASFSPNLSVKLLPGEKLNFTIVSRRIDSYGSWVKFDSVALSGNPLPEPTSMAVFGLLGAGIAARRIRRKA